MKLAIVTNILTPYRINFFDELNIKLNERGDELRVYAMCKEKSDRPWKYEELKREYTEVLPGSKIKIKGTFVFFNNVRKAFKKYIPDVVICAGSYWLPTTFRVVRLKRKFGYKTYMWSESHNKEKKNNSRFILKIRNNIRRNILKKFDGFLCASNLAKNLVAEYASINAKYIDLPNTVEGDFFHKAYLYEKEYNEEIRAKHGIVTEDYVFFTAARLVAEKGILNFLQVVKYLDDEVKQKALFLIAGEGELKEKIISFALKNNIRIKLVGLLSQEEIVKYYATCDCFLLPSLSDPNPLSVIECLWAGKPLLISDGVGNQCEAISKGENGYVFNYKKETEVIDFINRLVYSTSEWREIAKEKSLDIVKKHYETKKVIDNLIVSLSEA